jgi:predicted ATP-grasp superfamily ATP-dependent carboligase
VTTQLHSLEERAARREIRLASPVPDSKLSLRARPTLEKVLILDGNTRSALAATRSLGRKGVPVVVADEVRKTLSGASKYCGEVFAYPAPAKDPEAFIRALKTACCERNIRVVLPMTEISTATILSRRDQLGRWELPFPDFQAFDTITDKWKLFKLAQQLNISVPKTHFVGNLDGLADIYHELQFPVVLKPHRSMIHSQGRWTSVSVKYVSSPRELEQTTAQYECFRRHPFLIQEYISGEARGIFALYDRGKPAVFFAHRRLRENPPSGGVSVLSESIEPHPEARRMAQRILDDVGWHGVAMVEFKISSNGTPYLMEVNGRFWGSLQLAVDAGVDFPWLLYQMARGKELDPVKEYAIGVRCRWLLGDLARLYKVIANGGEFPCLPRRSKFRSLLEFLRFFETSSRYEVNRWDDVKPFLFELGQSWRQFRNGALN